MTTQPAHNSFPGDGVQHQLDQRNALYVLIQKAAGRLDALDPFGDGNDVPFREINEVRQWLSSETDKVIPPGDALVEEIT